MKRADTHAELPAADAVVTRGARAMDDGEDSRLPEAQPLEDTAEELADQELADEEIEDEAEDDDDRGPDEIGASPWRRWLRNLGACGVSMLIHMVGFFVLSLWLIPPAVRATVQTITAAPIDRPKDEELQEIELDPELSPATEMTAAVSSAPLAGLAGAVAGGGGPAVQLDTNVVQQLTSLDSNIKIEHPSLGAPTSRRMIAEVPEDYKGESRMIIDDYGQAFDIITQEIMWMLARGDVLVVWCFDQSGSMKDDQQEIQTRVEKVYHELGLTRYQGATDHLLTAVTSFGAGFAVHTPKPTSDFEQIRAAISQVPEDITGKEMTCEAVARSIRQFRSHTKRRQLALILVTDESGEQDNNLNFLEATIAEAKSAKCKIYTLARESVFGYPYAHIRWVHPQTKRPHWLRIDRGPETGFVEQLQTDGFRRRYDAFGSGFGPYEQTRMSRETGGIFFMLPSMESSLVRGHKRKYELERLRPYMPDLRARIEVFADRDRYPLRTFLWKVINDLNPYNKDAARVVEMRIAFSLNPADFIRQARIEELKATRFIRYLGEVQRILEEAAEHRRQEADPRWQANYDLIYAQTVAYQARLYEYGMALEEFIRNPQVAPVLKSPNLRLVHWDIGTRKQILVPEKSQPYIDKATELFQKVQQEHAGTPWAERASWELRRGFGVHLVPDYDPPYIPVSNPSPVPKL